MHPLLGTSKEIEPARSLIAWLQCSDPRRSDILCDAIAILAEIGRGLFARLAPWIDCAVLPILFALAHRQTSALDEFFRPAMRLG